ncbi:MAG: hypothetical protein ACC653_12490 [Gammaproteobacteria bacterium]
MKTEPLSIEIPAPKNAVLHYLSDIENFPEWATEFCQQLRKEDDHYKVSTPMGELYLRINADEKTGEIHYFATPEPNGTEYLPSKVTPIDDSSCQYMIDFSQPKNLSDEIYQQQCSAIKIEMQNIKNNFTRHH